jgi:hypothetical protein
MMTISGINIVQSVPYPCTVLNTTEGTEHERVVEIGLLIME